MMMLLELEEESMGMKLVKIAIEITNNNKNANWPAVYQNYNIDVFYIVLTWYKKRDV